MIIIDAYLLKSIIFIIFINMDLTTCFQNRIEDILKNLELSNSIDNVILQNRFLYEVMLYEQKRDKSKSLYDKFRFIVTFGSILLPAILSIGQMDPTKLPANFDNITYWATWGISLSVTISNGFLQLFSIDKQYFTYSIITEQLKTEGWQFVQLSGKYEKYSTHAEAYKTFCKSIETIKRKQIEQEFSSGKVDNKKGKNTFNFEHELNQFKGNIKPSIDSIDGHTKSVTDNITNIKLDVLETANNQIDITDSKKEDIINLDEKTSGKSEIKTDDIK